MEQVFEQDIAASARITDRAQAGIMIPMIEMHRNDFGLDEWGSGIGDLSLTARYDSVPGQALYWPGLGLLLSSTLPTGTAPDSATHRLATDATGEGTYDLTFGVNVDKSFEHVYAGVSGWATHRFAHAVSVPGSPPINESFALRWTLLAVVSYVFENESALGIQVSTMNEGIATINGASAPSTSLRTTTIGLAGVVPVRDNWRIQGSLFSDVMLGSFGRNEPAGYGLTAAIAESLAVTPRVLSRIVGAAWLTVALAASAAESQPPSLADITLERAGGEPVQLQKVIATHRLTVIVFFSSTCPCCTMHRDCRRAGARFRAEGGGLRGCRLRTPCQQ